MAAGRVLLRAAALGLAAATAGSLHGMSRWTPSWYISPVTPDVKRILTESALGLQASLHGARPLAGAHLADVRARAQHDLAHADAEDGADPVAASDLRLLLALLAARDGRADDALRLYEEAARDGPFDPRPRALAFHLCLLSGRMDEVATWGAAYRRLVPDLARSTMPGLERYDTRELVRELVIAATLGGVYGLERPEERTFVMTTACGTVDEGLVIAMQDEAMSMAEKLQLRALRVYLHAKVRQLVKKEEQDKASGVDDAW
ncbi:hypothetical protein QOZ80_1BG0069240 [Eleusine coracana subsp. coracana]|nr:hypothetical protein QOZ80_1BG0069240 [Eleusine coracana subsp. coracana]